MADKYAVDPTMGPAFTGPDLPSAEDQARQRAKLLDPGLHRSFIAGAGRGATEGRLSRPSFVAGPGKLDTPVPELSGDTRFSDYTRGAGKGLLDIAQGLAGTIELTGIVPQGTLTGPIADEAAEVIENMSPSAQENLRRKWATLDEESVARNPKAALLQLMTVLPSVAASFAGAGIGAAANVGRLGRAATAAQRASAAGVGGAVGGATVEAAQVGGATMNEIADMMNQVPHEQLVQQSATYARNYERFGDEGEARRATILDASREAAVGNALFSALTAMLPGYVFGKQAQRLGAAGRGRRSAEAAATEGVQEGIQESGTGVGTGTAYKEYIDAGFDPYGDFAERFVAGSALGAGAGGVVGALTPGPRSDADQTDDLPPEIRAALPAPQPKLPAPQDRLEGPAGMGGALPAPERGGLLEQQQYGLPDLPIPQPDPNQAIPMGGFTPATTSEQGQLDLDQAGPPVPGAGMGPPVPAPQLDTTRRGGESLADEVLMTLAGRRRYSVIPPNPTPAEREGLQRVYQRMRNERVGEGLFVEQAPDGTTLVTFNPKIAEAFSQGQPLPEPVPEPPVYPGPTPTGPEAARRQMGFPFTESAPAPEPTPAPKPRAYPGGMTRAQFEAADATLTQRRADREVADQLVQRIRDLDAERVTKPGEQADLFQDEERQAPPTQRKTAWGEQRKQMEKVARDAEQLAARGELTEEGVAQALETLDKLAVTTDKTEGATAALTKDFDTVRQLTDQYIKGELGATELLNYVDELIGGKRSEELKPAAQLKELQRVMAPAPEPVSRSPSIDAFRRRIKAAAQNVATDAKEPGGKSRGVMKQRRLFGKEEQAERLRSVSKKQKELFEKREAKKAQREQEQQDKLAEVAEKQYRAKQISAARAALNQRTTQTVEEAEADQRTLEALIAEQEAEMAAEAAGEITRPEQEVENLGVDMMADIEGRATGELVFEDDYGELAAEPKAPPKAEAKPPKRRKRKPAREVSDEEKAFFERANAVLSTSGDGAAGTNYVAGESGRRETVEIERFSSAELPQAVSEASLKEQYPNVEVADYQRDGINAMLHRVAKNKPATILGDGTGAGKTLQAAIVADQLRKQGKNVLIVTTGGRNAEVFPRDFAKLGTDMVGIDQTSYAKISRGEANGNYDVVIYDEAHNLKNTKSLWHASANQISSKHDIYITATPADTVEGMVLMAKANGQTLQEFASDLGISLTDDAEPVFDTTERVEDLPTKLAAKITHLTEDFGYMRRSIPRITEQVAVTAMPSTEKYTDTLTGDAALLTEWDDRIAASNLPANRRWAMSAKLSEVAKFPEVVARIEESLAAGRQVILMADRHRDETVEWESVDGTKHRVETPSILSMVAKYLQDTGRGDLVETYFGKDKTGPEKFQRGEKKILLTTYGKASESIDLDDQVGNAPRALISTMDNWSAITTDQAIGRVDRAGTRSTPVFYSLYSEGFEADRIRRSRMDSKVGIQQAIRGGEIAELSYSNNIVVEERGDRVFVSIVGLDFNRPMQRKIAAIIKDKSGGAPNWIYMKPRRTHSVAQDKWPLVEGALKAAFGDSVSKLETQTAPEAEPEPIPEPEEVVKEINDKFDPPTELPENDTLFFDRAAEKLARQYEISEDDLVGQGTGPEGKVLSDDVDRYFQELQDFESQSFDLFNVSRGLLTDTVPVLAKDLLLDIQKNTKRSSPMYDLLRTMIQRIGSTTVQLDEAAHYNYAGSYNIRGDQIRVNPRANTNKTLMHEALHAVLGHALETNPDFRRRVQKLREEFLIKIQDYPMTEQMSSIVREFIASTDENAHEFMSYALTEPEFQAALQDMPSKFNPKQTLWQKFKAMVAKVLRLNRRARTAFDDLVDLAKEGATLERQRDIPGRGDIEQEQQFSMAMDAAKPIYETINNYKGPRTAQQFRSSARRKATGILTLRQLESMYEGVLERLNMGNPVKKWIDALHRKEVTVKKYATTGNKKYRDYRKVEAAHPEHVKPFRRLIRNSTIYQIHPDKHIDHLLNKGVAEEGHADMHRALAKEFEALPPAMQREYKRLRDFYRDERKFELKQQLLNALKLTDASIVQDNRAVTLTDERIEALVNDLLAGRKKPLDVVLVVDGQIDYKLSELLHERIRENRAHMLQRGPYFPLKRFGQFTAYGERDHQQVKASLDADELAEIDSKAREYAERETKEKAGEWGEIGELTYKNRRDHLRRTKLTDKLNKQIRDASNGEPTRQRAAVEFDEDLTSATREHYDIYYSQHDSAAEAQAEAQRLKDEGYTVAEHEGEVKIGRRPDDIPQAMAAFGPLLASLRARLESKSMKAGAGKGGEYDRVFKALEASLLATLPETSVRLEALQRKNVPGSTEDAGRSLAAHVRGRGYYRGQLLHGLEIGEAMADINRAHRAVERDNKYSQTDQDRVQAVMDEVRKHDSLDSAGNELGEISRGLANVGFLWVLLSPVYILVNMTQPGMFTLPWLAARSKRGGATRAAAFLADAYKVMMPEFINRVGKSRGGVFGLNFNVDQELFDFLDPDGESIGRKLQKRILESDLRYKDELGDVLAHLAAQNLLDMTLAADTRSAAAGRTNESVWERTMDSARILPHLTEVLNRGVTAVAAYEMGRSEGMSKEQATKFAEDAIAETQFDYTLLNKPRYMSERAYSLAKPLFMFMQHPQHVYALFVKSALFGTRGAKKYWKLKRSGEFDASNPEHAKALQDYKQNRDTVMGILATHLLMGGVAGAMFEPAKWALGMTLMVNEALTGEPPEDTKTYVHRWLTSLAGEEGGEALMHGLPWALAGLNFSSNLSLSTLATFDQRFKEGREGFQDRVFSLLGPLPALGANIAEGFKDIKDGDAMGGFARMSPRTLREIIRAAKAADTGLQDSRGNVLIDADQMSPYELFASAMGINTAQKSRMYEDRAATLNLKYAHRDKQNRLKERLRRADTPGKRRAAMAAIAKYNRQVPIYARINIYGSQAASARTQRQIDKGGGTPLGQTERYLRQEL